MQLKQNWTVLAGVFAVATAAHGQLVVVDPVSIAQDALNQVVDLAKYVEMVNNQVAQLNNMAQQLQVLTASNRAAGDSAQILNVNGGSSVMQALQIRGNGQSLKGVIQNASGLNGIDYNTFGLYYQIDPVTLSGIPVRRSAHVYQQFNAIENTTANYASVYDDVTNRRMSLRSQMSDTVCRLQASTTDAETQKLNGVLIAQSAELHGMDVELANAAQVAQVQDIGNRNDIKKQLHQQHESLAADRHDALKKFGAMMVPDVNSDIRFGRGAQQ
ncbi:MAG: hypothetical protein WCO60_19375 [Verrucomicrobiota bacterium]